MKHKVQCANCGKTDRIVVEHGKKIKSKWAYFGKMTLNVCAVSKYFYRVKKGHKFGDREPLERFPNKCYDPEAKPVKAEYWECPECMKKSEEKVEK